ncbi:MAG: hypothetical protein ACQEV0_10180 [Bacillota bacterium]
MTSTTEIQTIESSLPVSNDPEKSVTNNSTDFPSAELMLSIIQKEYDIESSRKTTLENRAGILLTLAAAILTFTLSTLETALIKFPITSTIDFLVSFVYLFFGLLTVISIIISITQLTRVIVIREYERFDTSYLNEKNASYPLEISSLGLIEAYQSIISFNQSTNDRKTGVYSSGTYCLLTAILSSIIFYGLGLYL